MNQVAKVRKSGVAQFEPQKAREEVAKADTLIELAKKLQDWPLLETAVDHKIDEQGAFVRWWRDNVTPNRGGDRRSDQKRRSVFLVRDAEETTGITQQQVSKWAKWLKDPAKYRVRLFGAAWKTAMAKMATANELVQQSFSNEHYTPSEYIEAARAVLIHIDLDPTSCERANLTVKAMQAGGRSRHADAPLLADTRKARPLGCEG